MSDEAILQLVSAQILSGFIANDTDRTRYYGTMDTNLKQVAVDYEHIMRTLKPLINPDPGEIPADSFKKSP